MKDVCFIDGSCCSSHDVHYHGRNKAALRNDFTRECVESHFDHRKSREVRFGAYEHNGPIILLA